jgi:predicted  nucleic acid-binding Zn-ribbon protein
MLLQMLDSWTDERLNDLAASLASLPADVAKLTGAVEALEEQTRSLRQDLGEETSSLRQELAASQRQLVQVAWGLVAVLIAALVALLAALL